VWENKMADEGKSVVLLSTKSFEKTRRNIKNNYDDNNAASSQ